VTDYIAAMSDLRLALAIDRWRRAAWSEFYDTRPASLKQVRTALGLALKERTLRSWATKR